MWQDQPRRSSAKVTVPARSTLRLIVGTTGIVTASVATLGGLVFGMAILLRGNQLAHEGLTAAADPFRLATPDQGLKASKRLTSAEMAAALRREADLADQLVAAYRREQAQTLASAGPSAPTNTVAAATPPMPPEKPALDKSTTVAMTDPVAFPFPLPAPRPFFQPPRAPQVAEAKPSAPAAPFDKVAPETADDAKPAAPASAQLAYAPAAAPNGDATGDTGGGFFGGLFSSRTTPSAPAPSVAGRIGRGDRVAVYDISAGVVYMPNGEKLEAHSGVGHMRDNPRYTNVRMLGPTPPATYALTLREAPFHGVDAIRLTPVSGSTFGRDGFLAHTYMLRNRGDSNGCVVFADYDRFLRAFKRNEVKQLVVVPKLGDRMSALSPTDLTDPVSLPM